MKYVLAILLVSILSVNKVNAQAKEVFTIGPTIHFNFDKPKFNVSYGMECAYWTWDGFPRSVDAGIEFGGKKFRIYSEAQTGIALMGIALGPVLQFNFAESKVNLGFQSSFWMNYFIGIDVRFRRIGGTKVFSPGIYGKLPFGYGFYDDTNTTTDGDSHGSWDWD